MRPSPNTFFHRSQPWTRHVAHASFWLYAILGIGFAMGLVDVWGHDDEWFLWHFCVLSMIGLLMPWLYVRLLARKGRAMPSIVLGRIEFLVALSLLISWVGSFGLYRAGFGYDTAAHFTISGLLSVVVIAMALLARPELAEHPIRLAVIVCCLVILAGLINELYEWGGDQLFGTSMYGEAGQPDDTKRDLIANALGIGGGGVVGFRKRKALFSEGRA